MKQLITNYLWKTITCGTEERQLGILFLNRAGQLLGSLMSYKRPISGSSVACFTTHTTESHLEWWLDTSLLYKRQKVARQWTLQEKKKKERTHWHPYNKEFVKWNFSDDPEQKFSAADLKLWQMVKEYSKMTQPSTREDSHVNSNTCTCSWTSFEPRQMSRPSEECGWGNRGREKQISIRRGCNNSYKILEITSRSSCSSRLWRNQVLFLISLFMHN